MLPQHFVHLLGVTCDDGCIIARTKYYLRSPRELPGYCLDLSGEDGFIGPLAVLLRIPLLVADPKTAGGSQRRRSSQPWCSAGCAHVAWPELMSCTQKAKLRNLQVFSSLQSPEAKKVLFCLDIFVMLDAEINLSNFAKLMLKVTHAHFQRPSTLLEVVDTPNKSDYETASGAQTPAETLRPISNVHELVRNDDLLLTYSVTCTPQCQSVVTLNVTLNNTGQRAANIKNIIWSTVDTLNCKLQAVGATEDGVLLPFSLTTHQSNTTHLTYVLSSANNAIRMRGTLIYHRDSDDGVTPEQLHFSLRLPCSSLCHDATISRESYADLLALGDLQYTRSVPVPAPEPQLEPAQQISRALERLRVHAHMTTVDVQENKTNLYAQTVDGVSIAAMLQYKISGFTIDIKTSNSTLLDCLCKEYAEIVTGQWD